MRKLLVNPGKHDVVTSLGLLVLRLVPALLLVFDHGAARVKHFGVGIADPFGLGLNVSACILVGVELVAPILVGVGLFTRPAAVLSGAAIALITFYFPWWDASLVESGRTLPELYLAAFGGVVLTGAGTFSLDKAIQGKG